MMPLSLLNILGLGKTRPTLVQLQLADRSFANPEGIIEDILIKVISAFLVVQDFKADEQVPIILGWPFLATIETLIDVREGRLKIR